VLLLGTWHFAYPGKDAHKTERARQVDILSGKRQAQLSDLLDYLEPFKPDIVALECRAGSDFPTQYRAFLAGELEPLRDERYQIGFRIARRVGLETVHCIGAESFLREHMDQVKAMGGLPEGYDFKSDDLMSRRYKAWSEYRDRIQKEATLLEAFSYINQDANLDAGFGAYLVGDFKLDEYGGADALALHWYDRNLRIFRNLQRVTTGPDDRILVLYGSGHMQILKELVDSSPEYRRVSFGELGR